VLDLLELQEHLVRVPVLAVAILRKCSTWLFRISTAVTGIFEV